MKNFKKLISAVLTVVMLLSCLLTMASCKHEHQYTETVTAPTCTEKGYTTHTCECGDSYVDSYVDPAHDLVNNEGNPESCTGAYLTCKNCSYTTYADHNYVGKVTRFPSTTTEGIKTYTCSACGKSYSEKIQAVSMTLPNVSEILYAIIGANTFTVDVAEDSQLVLVKELSDYTANNGYKNFISFKVANAYVSGEGEALAAHLELKIGVAEYELNDTTSANDITAPTFSSFAECNIYVSGEDVSLQIANLGEQMNESSAKLSTVFYNAVAEMLGVSYENLVEMAYLGSLAQNYLPLAEGVIEAIASIKLPEVNTNVAELIALIGGSVVTESVLPNGNTRYSFDVSELAALLDGCGDKTIADLIDAQYGEGTVEAIVEFLVSVPEKKVKDIANSAISFSENCSVPVSDIYALINYFVFNASGTEFDIESEINTRYEHTVAQIIIELTGSEDDVAEYTELLKTNLADLVNTYTALTVDQIGNLMIYGNPYYTDEEGNEITPVTTALDMITSFVSESVFAHVELGADGKFVSLGFALVNGSTPMAQLTVSVDGANVTANVVANVGGQNVTASLVNNETSFTLTVDCGEDNLLTVFAPYGNDGYVGYVQVYLSTYVSYTDEETYEVTYVLTELLNATYTAENGSYTLSGTVAGMSFELAAVTGETSTELSLSLNGALIFEALLTETDNGTQINATIQGEETFEINAVVGQYVSFSVLCNDYVVMSGHANKDDYGTVTDASFRVNVLINDYNPETGVSTVIDVVNSLDVTYIQANDDGYEEFHLYFDNLDEVKYELTLKSKDGFASIDVCATMNDEVMVDAFVSAELVENGVTLTFDIPKYTMVVNNIVNAPVLGGDLGGEDGWEEGGDYYPDPDMDLQPVGEGKDDGGFEYVPGDGIPGGDGDYEIVEPVYVYTNHYFSLVGEVTITLVSAQ